MDALIRGNLKKKYKLSIKTFKIKNKKTFSRTIHFFYFLIKNALANTCTFEFINNLIFVDF